MNCIKTIIADDHALFVNGLMMLLAQEPSIDLIGEASNGRDLLELLHIAAPDLVLLDINMPVINGIETARYIRQTNAEVKLIMLSTYDDDHLIERARQVGVNGYLLKNSSKEELMQTIRVIMNNQTAFPYRRPKDENVFDREDGFLKPYHLTKREREILGLLKDNYTNQQIAEKLFLSVYTVETHRKNIMQKLNLKSPAALIKFLVGWSG